MNILSKNNDVNVVVLIQITAPSLLDTLDTSRQYAGMLCFPSLAFIFMWESLATKRQFFTSVKLNNGHVDEKISPEMYHYIFWTLFKKKKKLK